MLHAALDLLIEILGPSKPANLKRFSQGSNWLGCLCSLEEYDLYGYSTPTSTKIIALIAREQIVPLKKRREADIKALFVSVHFSFVRTKYNIAMILFVVCFVSAKGIFILTFTGLPFFCQYVLTCINKQTNS